jgi:hypothetical protein
MLTCLLNFVRAELLGGSNCLAIYMSEQKQTHEGKEIINCIKYINRVQSNLMDT